MISEHDRLLKAVFENEPYFGRGLGARQGDVERHRYFKAAVNLLGSQLERPVSLLEVGVWAGGSTLSWAAAFKELGCDFHITCVDPWLPYFDLSANTDSHYQIMQSAAEAGLIYPMFMHNIRAAGIEDKVTVLKGTSADILPSLSDDSFNIVYLDGSHAYKDVCFDIVSAKRLITENGIICGDDLEALASELSKRELSQAITSNADYLYSEKLGRSYHPGVTGAVRDEFGAVCVREGFWAVVEKGGDFVAPKLPKKRGPLPKHIAQNADAFTLKHVTMIEGIDIYQIDDGFCATLSEFPIQKYIDIGMSGVDLLPYVFFDSDVSRLKERVLASIHKDDDTPSFVKSYKAFNIVTSQKVYGAFRRNLGNVDLSHGLVETISALSHEDAFLGNSVDDVVAKIDTRCDMDQIITRIQRLEVMEKSREWHPPELIGQYQGYNIVDVGSFIIGVSANLGSVDTSLSLEKLRQTYGHRDIISAATSEQLKQTVDELLREDEMLTRLSAFEEMSANFAQSIEKVEGIADTLSLKFDELQTMKLDDALSALQSEIEKETASVRQYTDEVSLDVQKSLDQLRNMDEGVDALKSQVVENAARLDAVSDNVRECESGAQNLAQQIDKIFKSGQDLSKSFEEARRMIATHDAAIEEHRKWHEKRRENILARLSGG